MDAGLELIHTRYFSSAIKRSMDVIGAVIGLILIGPLLLLVAVLIQIETPGEILFRQERVGFNGKRFWMLKFRTMRACAEQELLDILSSDLDRQVEYECYQKLALDPRLTRVGRFLRRFSLDELPQLWNVLQGEMSLVGPRPILPEQIPLYGSAYSNYRKMAPGMTGQWQVSGRNLLSFEERVHLDTNYIQEWSIWVDLKILLVTPWTILSQRGAY